MKRDRKMTIRFGGNESMADSRKAAGEDVRTFPHLRVLPDRQADGEMTKSEAAEEQQRTHRPQAEDDIQRLEQLIRQENGTIAQRGSDQPLKDEDVPDLVQPSSGPSVWTFPEPIKQAKAKNVETERKLNSAANRIEDASVPAQHPASSASLVSPVSMNGQPMYSTGRMPVVQPDNPGSPLVHLGAEDKPYSISDWDLGSLEGGQSSGRFGILPAAADYSHTRSRGPSWLKVFASVAGAIATGALFGYLALALFAGQGPWSGGSGSEGTTAATAADPAIAPSGSSSGNGAPAVNGSGSIGTTDTGKQIGGNSPANSEAAPALAQIDLEAQSFHALQYGVFSSSEGADAAVSELADRGLAAYRWDTESDFRVYVGMSGDRDGALALSQLLDGMEVYVKAIELPAVQRMPFSGDADVLRNYWAQTNELISLLDNITLGQLELNTPKPLSANISVSWKKLHEQWLSSSAAVAAKLTSEQDKKASAQLAQSINTAAVSLAEFDKKPAASHLWNAQSALMAAVFAEKGWLESSGGL